MNPGLSSHSTVAAGRSMSSHARLHKRGGSGSSVSEQLSPKSPGRLSFSFTQVATPPTTYEEDHDEARSPETMTSPVGGGLKIRPYLKKLASKDENNMLDLSRSAAENESRAGLGISDYSGHPRSASDITAVRSHRHGRSTSNTSQLSASSSLHRPTVPYAHPMRQTPRSYTPPLAQSFPNSATGSEISADATAGLSEHDLAGPPGFLPSSYRSHSSNSTSRPSHMLRMRTSESSTRGGRPSQTSLNNTPPAGMHPLKSFDVPASSTRSSIDRAVSFIRTRDDQPVDPTERAAHIQAARRAYQEKELAKERKAEIGRLKQYEKENRVRYKQDERRRREIQEREARGGAAADSAAEKAGALAFEGTERSRATDNEKRRPSANRRAVSPWLRFTTWFRTRLLKLGRKLKMV